MRQVRYRLTVLAACIAAMALPAPIARADGPSREYQVKAAFVYNFVQFVDWPDQAFADAKAPIVITVLGPNPFGAAIEQVTRGKTIRGREVSVRYVQALADVGRTQVLFCAAPEFSRAAEAMRDAAAANVLTIADDDEFMAAGGMIRFFTEEHKLRFEINAAAAARAGLKVSAKLLQLARLYRES